MASVFVRGSKLYAKIQDVTGKWQQVATGLAVGQEQQASRWVAERVQEARAARARAGALDGATLTVRDYAEQWLSRRKTKTVKDDTTRLRLHVLPVVGDVLLVDVRPRHARDLVQRLREAATLAPKTIREIAGLLHTMFKSAVIEELLPTNPITFERGVLPRKVDKDPTWRHEAIYTRAELEQIISDRRLLPDRRILYALKTLGALRHGEAARLTIAQYDKSTTPLRALNLGTTKSGMPRRVPVHPTLATVLDEWLTSGWEQVYGRKPTPADLIVPTRRFRPRAAAEAQKQLLADLELLGLRTSAGAERNRRGHDMRRSLITVARADGAIDSWLRWVTHGPRGNEMLDVYSSPPWEVLCSEIAKIQLQLRGAVLVQPPQLTETIDDFERPQRGDSQTKPGRPYASEIPCITRSAFAAHSTLTYCNSSGGN